MKSFALYSPNIMYILTANQNARVIMKIYYDHCDWLRDDTKRAFGVLTIGKNGTIGRPFNQWYQCYQHRAANNADKIQHVQIYQRSKSHMIQYGGHQNVSNQHYFCQIKEITLYIYVHIENKNDRNE